MDSSNSSSVELELVSESTSGATDTDSSSIDDNNDSDSVSSELEWTSSDSDTVYSGTSSDIDPESAEPEVIPEPLHSSMSESCTPGVNLSVFESHLLIYEFSIKNNLSVTATDELLQLMQAHLPQAKLPKSCYLLKQFFSDLFPDLASSIHFYCSCCHCLLANGSDSCTRCSGYPKESFVSLPIGSQLRRKLEDADFWESLQSRFKQNTVPDVIQDVYDGEEYRRHSEFLSNPSNISLTCNTDGVAIFQSSKVELWPVWLSINELPKQQRFEKKNMILGALWFSAIKPTMTTFLEPLIDEFNDIYKNGIKVQSPRGKTICRAMLLQVSADLPARARVANMKQYNGAYGCLYCESCGTTSATNSLHRFWPIEEAPLRTHTMIMNTAKEATRRGDAVKGVFGASVMVLHKPFDLVKGIVVDDLHGIYLGVTKTLLKLWFSDKYKSCDFYIGRKLDLCDKRILNVRVTDTISRTPKKVSDKAHWKGSEYRTWILFLALPVLSGLLAPCYYNNLCDLVSALHILYSDYITRADLDRAERLLKQFYTRFSELYGDRETTMNVHLLSHLTMCVRNWGPLWSYSCFQFESMNKEIKKHFRGTRNMSKQVAFSFVMLQVLPRIQAQCANRLNGSTRQKKRSKVQELTKEVYAVGKVDVVDFHQTHQLVQQYLSLRLHRATFVGAKVSTFLRLRMGKECFTSSKYTRVKKRNSHTVIYDKLGYRFGSIIQYFYIIDGNTVITMALIQTLNVVNKINESVPLYKVCRVAECYDVVDLSSIKEKCVSVCIDDSSEFVCRFPCNILVD